MDLGSSILLTSHKVAALNRKKKEKKKAQSFYLCREEGKKLARNLTEILTHLVLI
jgi:hypothetical protein